MFWVVLESHKQASEPMRDTLLWGHIMYCKQFISVVYYEKQMEDGDKDTV